MNKILIGIDPMPAPRMTDSDRWKTINNPNPKYRQRPVVSKYLSYKDIIVWACKKYKYELQPQIDLVFNTRMPDSYSKKKKLELNNTPHQLRPDLDNLIKGVLDSFGVEDSFVHTIRAKKVWAEYGSIEIS